MDGIKIDALSLCDLQPRVGQWGGSTAYVSTLITSVDHIHHHHRGGREEMLTNTSVTGGIVHVLQYCYGEYETPVMDWALTKLRLGSRG